MTNYKDVSNYDIALDIYCKIMKAKTVYADQYGAIKYDEAQSHIDIAEIVEHLFFIKHTDKTVINE